MPLALRAEGAEKEPRAASRPALRLVFLTAVLALPFGLEGREASSSFRRASFSAFLRAASAALAAAASLFVRFVSPILEKVAHFLALEWRLARRVE